MTATYIKAATLRERYDNVSDMWIVRRLQDKVNPLPQPTKLGGQRFWNVAELDAWDRARGTPNGTLPKIIPWPGPRGQELSA